MPDTFSWVMVIGSLVVAAIAIISMFIKTDRSRKTDDQRLADLVHTALTVKQNGNFREAEDLLRKAVGHFKDSRKPHFAMYTSCVMNLAHCCLNNGSYEEASALYTHMLELWKASLQKPHPESLTDIDYAASANDFGTVTSEVADFYPQVVAAKRQIYGIAHQEVVNSMIVHAQLLKRVGRIDEAQAVEMEATKLQQTIST